MTMLDNDAAVQEAIAWFQPDRYARLRAIEEANKRDEERETYEGSFLEFFIRAWREVEGQTPLSLNWHHRRIIKLLERITYGEVRNAIINVPPRFTKSRLVNIFWPAWTWCRSETLPLSGPHVTFFCVAYAADLAEDHALRMQWLVCGEWYQSLWGDRVKLRPDQHSRANFGNYKNGERVSNSIEGGLLGKGGLIQIIDDPHKVKGAESDVERGNTLTAFGEGLSTRISDPRVSARVLIMQRLHEEDCTNWALDHWPGDTVHLMYPARFDPSRACDSDPRTYEGEPLWPAMWSEEAIAQKEIELGPYAFAGQYQQIPTPRTGGIIDRTDWNVYPEQPPDPRTVRRMADGQIALDLPELSYVLLTLDTAMSEKETADWNACIVWGIWHRRRSLVGNTVGIERPWFAGRWSSGSSDPEETLRQIAEDDDQPRAIMMEAWRRRCKLNDETPDRMGKPSGLVQRIVDTARRRRVDRIVIEDKTRSKDVKDEIIRQYGDEFIIDMFNPNKHGDKVARQYSVQPLFSQGLIYAPGKYELVTDAAGREYCEVREEFVWVQAVLSEVATVPRGRHDDFADCVSMGLITLRENGLLELTHRYMQNALRDRMRRPNRQTVAMDYGV